jgi:hypothetical protein
MTARERLMVAALRELVADSDGALEVLDALDAGMREHIADLADMTLGSDDTPRRSA